MSLRQTAYRAFAATVTAAFLAACGAAQPPGALPSAHADRRAPPRSDALLYLSLRGTRDVSVFTFPGGKPAGRLAFGGRGQPAGLCTDAAGDVFIAVDKHGYPNHLYEYAHGGSKPIAVLSEDGVPNSCTVDPSSGDLAAVNTYYQGYKDGVAIFRNAKGRPTYYTAAELGFGEYYYCAYDDAGDLFITGDHGLAELPKGATYFETLRTPPDVITVGIAWNRGDVVASAGDGLYPEKVWRLSVSGYVATLVGTTLLRTPERNGSLGRVELAIAGRDIVMPNEAHDTILGWWRFPKGGAPLHVIPTPKEGYGVAVSSSE